MDTDKWLTRLIAGTVCLLAVLMVLTACWQVLNGYEADKNIHDLTYLIVGGLLSQVTTHAVQTVKDGMQNVQVPAPLVPADVLATPDAPTPTPAALEAPADAPSDAMPDPDGADPGVLEPDPAR